ncbi:hybrid sensor histidine kinase/response regulator [Agrilutibacter solisilvae]|uniref:hybrid sensor histidine kinase/response regulator n=1 Tax=Agrilutibacter solisilvae TaxID=2763317 RepID=UPI001FD708DF|nr:two-component regulator propeller domain-containing protein [Lysobacter solisilvae]
MAGIPPTPRLRQLTVADGLPSNRINALAQDRQGYLWVATSDGVARLGGQGHRLWRAEQGLQGNFAWSVHVDAADRVWVGTRDAGLAMLDSQRRHWRYYHRDNTPQLGSNEIWVVTTTSDGAVWFGTADAGLYRLAPGGGVSRFLPRAGDARSLPDLRVSHLAQTPDGSLWVGTKNGAARWTGRDFERLPPSALPSQAIEGLAVDDAGALWVATTAGVVVRGRDGGFTTPTWVTGDVLRLLLRDRGGESWVDIRQGLGLEDGTQVINVPLYSPPARGMVRPSWVTALQDRRGGLWFASSSHGLWHLPPSWRQFSTFAREADNPDSLGNGHVRGIANAADGQAWLVGTGGALDLFDPDTGAIQHRAADVGEGASLSAVFEDASGAVWVGYRDGLVRIGAGDAPRRWSARDAQDPALSGETVAFLQDAEGLVWMASASGGVQARDARGAVLHSVLPGDDHGVPRGAELHQLGRGPDGAVWLSGSHGLSMWNSGARRFEPVPGAPRTRIPGFALDARGQVWLASFGRLQSFAWNGATLTPAFDMGGSDGMPMMLPSGVAVDASGVAWVSSRRGLVRVDPATRSARAFDVRDGLLSQELDAAPVARRGDGRLMLGSSEGLIVFDPAVVRPDTGLPPLVIESFDVQRGDHRIALSPTQPFTLGEDDRDLRITARLLDFDETPQHLYRFQLVGHDRGWVAPTASGERVFSRLPAGRYRLEITARTADSPWSPPLVVRFAVASPWWWTWWSIASYIVAGLLVLAAVARAWRTRVRRRHAWQLTRQQQELAEQASLAKTRFLATLGHEVRTPMTGVLGMSELLLGTALTAQQRGYVGAIRGAGEHLLRLVNDALDLARIESGKLELADESFDIHALVEDLAALIGPLARQRGLAFALEIGGDLPRALRGDPARVRQILLNLLGNAIKFTEHGRVTLHAAALVPVGVQLEVRDTGPGLNAEQKARLFRRFEQGDGARTRARYGGSGLGLAISQELAAAMGGAIEVDGAPGEGTRFTVRLPLPLAVAPAPREENVMVQVAASRSLSLLLVEDDPTVADVLTGLLRLQGHHVVHVPHGLAALAAAVTTPFDAALLDLDLPGMDGMALARQLRTQGFERPLIAVTARADAGAEPEALQAGFDRFIRKPMTLRMLAELLQGLQPEPEAIDPTQLPRALAQGPQIVPEETASS